MHSLPAAVVGEYPQKKKMVLVALLTVIVWMDSTIGRIVWRTFGMSASGEEDLGVNKEN